MNQSQQAVHGKLLIHNEKTYAPTEASWCLMM